MFKPEGADSIWVSIRKLRWGWEANLINDGPIGSPNWQPDVFKKDPIEQGPTNQMPEWTAWVEDLKSDPDFWQPVDQFPWE